LYEYYSMMAGIKTPNHLALSRLIETMISHLVLCKR
jgi:hypothetical protein